MSKGNEATVRNARIRHRCALTIAAHLDAFTRSDLEDLFRLAPARHWGGLERYQRSHNAYHLIRLWRDEGLIEILDDRPGQEWVYGWVQD